MSGDDGCRLRTAEATDGRSWITKRASLLSLTICFHPSAWRVPHKRDPTGRNSAATEACSIDRKQRKPSAAVRFLLSTSRFLFLSPGPSSLPPSHLLVPSVSPIGSLFPLQSQTKTRRVHEFADHVTVPTKLDWPRYVPFLQVHRPATQPLVIDLQASLRDWPSVRCSFSTSQLRRYSGSFHLGTPSRDLLEHRRPSFGPIDEEEAVIEDDLTICHGFGSLNYFREFCDHVMHVQLQLQVLRLCKYLHKYCLMWYFIKKPNSPIIHGIFFGQNDPPNILLKLYLSYTGN